jgi:4-amino-4-deoxy-L-arabinose transferase-like glycosyltransferase
VPTGKLNVDLLWVNWFERPFVIFSIANGLKTYLLVTCLQFAVANFKTKKIVAITTNLKLQKYLVFENF